MEGESELVVEMDRLFDQFEGFSNQYRADYEVLKKKIDIYEQFRVHLFGEFLEQHGLVWCVACDLIVKKDTAILVLFRNHQCLDIESDDWSLDERLCYQCEEGCGKQNKKTYYRNGVYCTHIIDEREDGKWFLDRVEDTFDMTKLSLEDVVVGSFVHGQLLKGDYQSIWINSKDFLKDSPAYPAVCCSVNPAEEYPEYWYVRHIWVKVPDKVPYFPLPKNLSEQCTKGAGLPPRIALNESRWGAVLSFGERRIKIPTL